MRLDVVTVPLEEGAIPVTRIAPADAGPLLVFLPSIFGVGADVVAHSERFASAGALVAAIDPFWRQLPGPLAVGREMEAALARRREHSDEDMRSDLSAVIDWGRRQPLCNGRVIVLGVCYGGRFALEVAAEGLADAAAVWHGAGLGALLPRAPEISVPLRLEFGGADPLTPPEEIEAIRAAFAPQREVKIQMHPGAGHGFSHVETEACEPAAAEASARSVLELIAALRGA